MRANDATKSGIGLPHSKTLPRWIARLFFREVVECGSPMPLSFLAAGGVPGNAFRLVTSAATVFGTGSRLL
jgi:hypothetical protein